MRRIKFYPEKYNNRLFAKGKEKVLKPVEYLQICLKSNLKRKSYFTRRKRMSKITGEKLMEALSFDEQDLSLNLQLKLSLKQRNKLKPAIELHIFISFFGTLICFFAAGFTLFSESKSVDIFFLSLLCLSAFGLCFYWHLSSLIWQRHLKNYNGVRSVEGEPDFDITYGDPNQKHNIPHYSMKINGVRFYMDEKTYDSISSKKIKVYYFQTLRKKILSIENLE